MPLSRQRTAPWLLCLLMTATPSLADQPIVPLFNWGYVTPQEFSPLVGSWRVVELTASTQDADRLIAAAPVFDISAQGILDYRSACNFHSVRLGVFEQGIRTTSFGTNTTMACAAMLAPSTDLADWQEATQLLLDPYGIWQVEDGLLMIRDEKGALLARLEAYERR